MRQIATALDGTGYIIDYSAGQPPAEIEKIRQEIMATPNEQRQEDACMAKIKKYNDGIAAWQAKGVQVVANLVADGVFVGEFEDGAAARAYVDALEELQRGQLAWRTE